jgi:methionyl aminopeptidase
MSIDDPQELEGLRRAGAVVAATLRDVRARVRPGVTTAELDAAADRVFDAHGARSGPRLDYGFPGTICISVDAEAVHGIPGPRALREGELVKLDVTAELDGYYADACVTVPVGSVAPRERRLISAAAAGLRRGIAAATAGAPLNAIGSAVEHAVVARGFCVCSELTGHGIGRRIHEPPTVANVFDPAASEPLTPGLVITVEPIIAAGRGAVIAMRDGWTVRTADGSPVAHAEHTIVVTDAEPIVLTSPNG